MFAPEFAKRKVEEIIVEVEAEKAKLIAHNRDVRAVGFSVDFQDFNQTLADLRYCYSGLDAIQGKR